MTPSVAVLFARVDSVYKSIPGCDVFDINRDARSYAGSLPVVAHPPCRSWGRLRQFAKPRPDERDLAFFAIQTVRRCGGVLEHPSNSTLWRAGHLPGPFEGSDHFGGWTLCVDQSWFGHPAPKRTWLYVCGVERSAIPAFPLRLGVPAGRVERLGRAAREHTPQPFAVFLRDLATGAIQ